MSEAVISALLQNVEEVRKSADGLVARAETLARELAEREGIAIDTIGGNCPVQAEGTFDGLHFYFRARGRHWQFHVAETKDGILRADIRQIERSYTPLDGGKAEYAAGWMTVAEAIIFIVSEVKDFRRLREECPA